MLVSGPVTVSTAGRSNSPTLSPERKTKGMISLACGDIRPTIWWPSRPSRFCGAPNRPRVARAGEGAPLQRGQAALDQGAVAQVARAQDAVEPLPDHVQRLVRFDNMQADARVPLQEAGQGRQQEIPRLGAVDVDADQARRLGSGEGPLRLL